MKKRITTQTFLCLFFFMIFSISAFSQNAEISNEVENHDPKEFTTYEYVDTPSWAFGYKKKNPFKDFTADQINVLQEYGYPKFKTRGDIYLEEDIMFFQSEIKEWVQLNTYRIEEFRSQLDYKK